MDPNAIDTTAEMTDRADQAALDAFQKAATESNRYPEWVHAGINPEAVPDLLVACSMALTHIEYSWHSPEARRMRRAHLTSVIAKAIGPVGASDPPTLPEGP